MIKKSWVVAVLFLLIQVNVIAQNKIIFGIVKDGHSDERLPFSSAGFKNTSIGKTTDSAGAFQFQFDKWPSDTIIITSISYTPYIFIIPKNIDTIYFTASLQSNVASAEVIVKAKAKHTRGWYLWSKVVAHKDKNNIFENDNFTYHVYNRLEIDINNINPASISKSRFFKPFSKIINSNIDTLSEDKPILPTFFSETVSDYYYQKNPYKTREEIIANKISGVKNESITKYLGALNQNIVLYGSFIPVFNKQFVSPISDNGDAYYDYRLADTQYLGGRRLLHLIFIPKHDGQNTFIGDCWVHDTTFAIQKIILHLNKDANINFVDKLSLVQEFKLINDSTWFLCKDKFFVTLSPIGNKKTGFIARKTTNYKDVITNSNGIAPMVAKNKVSEEVEVLENAKYKENSYWDTARIEQLSKAESNIYKMMDTIQKLPAYKKYYNTFYFIGTGYKNIGKFQIGPWASWISGNVLEGTRVRFDIGTNKKFSKKIYLHGYLAYGFTDERWKQKGEILWLIKHNPWQSISASYSNDLNFSQNYYVDIPRDNVLAVAFRKTGIPIKLINLKEAKIQYFKDSKIGLSTTLTLSNKIYDPLFNLPGKGAFTGNDIFNTTELSAKLRFGYIEKFFENNFFRYSLGSAYPIPEIEFTQGIKGLLNSQYSYQKIKANVSTAVSIAPYGKIAFNVFAGKVYGTLPYMMLEVHPGNEVHFYNKYAFNLMNRYEFVSDKYAGFSLEHSLGNGIFRFIPLTRKLKFRQFWNVKAVTGSLNDANKLLNFVSNYSFQSLDNKLYLEAGTGIDNIFKVLRLDFIWRLLPTPLPAARASRFGVFGSFKLQL